MSPALVPFCERSDLAADCIALINEEWPKSETARRVLLERASNPDPPMAFVLLDDEKRELLGYARFLHVFNYVGRAAFFDTVIIRRAFQGKGLGRSLMDLLKEEAKKRGYELLLLCTVDKEVFYEKCGYKLCQPLRLVTRLAHNSKALAGFMAFDRPILPEEKSQQAAEEKPQQAVEGGESLRAACSSMSAPPPPLPVVSKNLSYKCEQYMFHYVK